MTPELADQFAAMGVATGPAPPVDDVIEVWAENWGTLNAFLDLQTQWRFSEACGRIWMSLDYGAADVVLRRNRHDVEFSDLQTMELAAVAAFEGR
jgi:hypothetical protein